MIVDQADRCKKIVAGLLNFARQNKVVLQRGPARSGVPLQESAPREHQSRMEHDDQDLVAEVDRDQIVQVLTNLIGNAGGHARRRQAHGPHGRRRDRSR